MKGGFARSWLLMGANRFSVAVTVELYDRLTGAFTATGSISAARIGHTATLLANGKVPMDGGRVNQSSYDQRAIGGIEAALAPYTEICLNGRA